MCVRTRSTRGSNCTTTTAATSTHTRQGSIQVEVHLDINQHLDWPARECSGLEFPPLHSFNGLVVEPRTERTRDNDLLRVPAFINAYREETTSLQTTLPGKFNITRIRGIARFGAGDL